MKLHCILRHTTTGMLQGLKIGGGASCNVGAKNQGRASNKGGVKIWGAYAPLASPPACNMPARHYIFILQIISFLSSFEWNIQQNWILIGNLNASYIFNTYIVFWPQCAMNTMHFSIRKVHNARVQQSM